MIWMDILGFLCGVCYLVLCLAGIFGPNATGRVLLWIWIAGV